MSFEEVVGHASPNAVGQQFQYAGVVEWRWVVSASLQGCGGQDGGLWVRLWIRDAGGGLPWNRFGWVRLVGVLA
jgi:hypothetical protein